MRLVTTRETDTAAVLDAATVDQLIAAVTAFMAADSDAEAVAEIDRDLKRAA
jgi:hypothetical protein